VSLAIALAAVVWWPLAGCQPSEDGADGSAASPQAVESDAPITDTLATAPDGDEAAAGESAAPAAEAAPAEPAAPSDQEADDAPSTTDAGEPLALDMLSEDEAAAAEELALEAASGVLSAATDRDSLSAASDLSAYSEQPTYRLMYSQRFDTKGDEPRSAEVAYYRYDTNEIVLTRVELESGEVAPLAVPPGFMAPLLGSEIDEAARAARLDDAVRSALEEDGLDPDEAVANGLLTTVADEGDDICSATRCIRLFFFGPERVVPNFTVVVDVSNMAVVAIVPNIEATSQQEAPANSSGGQSAAPDESEGAAGATTPGDQSEEVTP
jgi:hypothetical protein